MSKEQREKAIDMFKIEDDEEGEELDAQNNPHSSKSQVQDDRKTIIPPEGADKVLEEQKLTAGQGSLSARGKDGDGDCSDESSEDDDEEDSSSASSSSDDEEELEDNA